MRVWTRRPCGSFPLATLPFFLRSHAICLRTSSSFFSCAKKAASGSGSTMAKDTVCSDNARKALVHILSWQRITPSGRIAAGQKRGANPNAEKGIRKVCLVLRIEKREKDEGSLTKCHQRTHTTVYCPRLIT